MKRLLWKLCGFDARARQQRLRHKLQWVICMDELNGWLETYTKFQHAPEVRV